MIPELAAYIKFHVASFVEDLSVSLNVGPALHSPTSPFTDLIMAGAPSVAIAVSFAMGRFAFLIEAIIASFTSMLQVLSFNGTISRSYSLMKQSVEINRANIAN